MTDDNVFKGYKPGKSEIHLETAPYLMMSFRLFFPGNFYH